MVCRCGTDWQMMRLGRGRTPPAALTGCQAHLLRLLRSLWKLSGRCSGQPRPEVGLPEAGMSSLAIDSAVHHRVDLQQAAGACAAAAQRFHLLLTTAIPEQDLTRIRQHAQSEMNSRYEGIPPCACKWTYIAREHTVSITVSTSRLCGKAARAFGSQRSNGAAAMLSTDAKMMQRLGALASNVHQRACYGWPQTLGWPQCYCCTAVRGSPGRRLHIMQEQTVIEYDRLHEALAHEGR